LLANDEFFAAKENLLEPGRGTFIEGRYTERGKWMDGWETRRRREPGHDWCIVRLGIPGALRGILVDTNHFRGNFPESCSLDACELAEEPPVEALPTVAGWTEVVPRTSLQGHSENRIPVADGRRFTHVRLNIFPDGGVARLRVLGEARPDWERLTEAGGLVDLVAIQHGGLPVACSDQFFSEPLNLLLPGRAADMGDGWETRRRRGPGHDWVVLRLGHRGTVQEIEVDTNHFKGNFPESCSLEACDAANPGEPEALSAATWFEILLRTGLRAHTRHAFAAGAEGRPMTHVRFHIYPDGGVSRLRLLGRPVA
jgi:allantoicase